MPASRAAASEFYPQLASHHSRRGCPSTQRRRSYRPFTLPTVSAVRTELTGAVMGSDDWQDRASQASANALKDAIAKSEAATVGFETLSRAGQPAEAIAQVARDKGIEHIVMGTQG